MRQTVNQILHSITQELIKVYHDHDAAEHNSWWLLEKLTNKDRADLIILETIELSSVQEQQLADWLHKIVVEHMPLQYILGAVPFIDVTIAVKPPVIIPRPETEYWCSLAIEQLKKYAPLPDTFSILDICSGSGCIALAFAKEFSHSTVYAVDISDAALELAEYNARLNRISNVAWVRSDIYDNLPNNLLFDIIVSNPPYIDPDQWELLDPEVTKWEDQRGLVAAHHGYAIIEKIIANARARLHQSSTIVPQLWIEIGAEQGAHTQQLMIKAGFHHVTIIKDLTHRDRVVVGTL